MNNTDRDKGRDNGTKRRRETAAIRATKVRQMFDEGIAVGKIAEHFRVSRQTISNDLKKPYPTI